MKMGRVGVLVPAIKYTNSGRERTIKFGLFGILLCEVLILLLPPRTVGAEDVELVTRIRNEAYSHLASIDTVRCRATVERSTGGRSLIYYVRDGDRYRVERDDTSPSIINEESFSTPYQIWTFDGERYRMFDDKRKALKLTDGKGASGSADPISLPFNFIAYLRCKSPFREDLQSPETWDEIFVDATPRGRKIWQGKDCEVLEFSQVCTDPSATLLVYFLIEESYFPVRCERWLPDEEVYHSLSEIVEYTKITKDNQRFVIPLSYRYEQGEDDFTTTTITQESVVINEPISSETFTIDRKLASSVYDVQKELEDYEESRATRKEVIAIPQGFSLMRRIAMVANMAFVCLVLAFLWLKRTWWCT